MSETKTKKRHTGRIIMLVILAVGVLVVGVYRLLSKTFLTRHPELRGVVSGNARKCKIIQREGMARNLEKRLRK